MPVTTVRSQSITLTAAVSWPRTDDLVSDVSTQYKCMQPTKARLIQQMNACWLASSYACCNFQLLMINETAFSVACGNLQMMISMEQHSWVHSQGKDRRVLVRYAALNGKDSCPSCWTVN